MRVDDASLIDENPKGEGGLAESRIALPPKLMGLEDPLRKGRLFQGTRG